ncbi:MAG TPA: RNase adapter RapZ [Gammaproteobacteria bacterium]|nr:RNase adapter RapZ [Gammaproteobacteria bacterium]
MKLVILSGLSGSGKSVALNMLEDLGYYCIDNLPITLIESVARATILTGEAQFGLMALGVDARNRGEDIATLADAVGQLRDAGVSCDLVFLHAAEEKLVKRYSETRRRHPLSRNKMSLRDAIRTERDLLAPVAQHADLSIDTTETSIHDLRTMIRQRVHRADQTALSILIESFAFRHGVPADADFVFDARCLPNPYWDLKLRPYSGRETQVIEFLDAQPEVAEMLTDIGAFLDKWIPRFEANDRSYLTVAIGCTGGFHRSVYLSERLGERLRATHENVIVRHNEVN